LRSICSETLNQSIQNVVNNELDKHRTSDGARRSSEAYLRTSIQKADKFKIAQALVLFSKMHTVYANKLEKHLDYILKTERICFDVHSTTLVQCWSILDALEDAMIHLSPLELDDILLQVI